jgi:hypothetical protein
MIIMAIYSNLTALPAGNHGIFQSSLLKATISGHLWDCRVVDGENNEIPVDNGVAVKVGAFTHADDGLQERFATIAGVHDKIGVTGSPAIVKDALLAS